MVYEVAKLLAEEHEVHVFCHHCPKAPNEEVMEGILVHRSKIRVHPHSYFRRFLSSSTLPFVLLRRRFDVIITTDFFPPIPSYVTAKAKRTPIILISGGLFWSLLKKNSDLKPENTRFSEVLARIATRVRWIHTLLLVGSFIENRYHSINYDAWIVVSETARKELVQIGVKRDKIFLINMGVNLKFFDSIIKKEERKRPTVGFVGNLVPSKGILDLIEAFNLVLKEIPQAKLVIAGDGPEKKKAMRKSNALYISENIEFLGLVNYEESAKIIKSSDCIVIPGLVEKLSLVLLEAMACRTPVIAYDIPVVNDLVINGNNGYLVYPRDINQLSKRIVRILLNPALKEKLGKQGRELVEKRYTWKQATDRILSIICRLVFRS